MEICSLMLVDLKAMPITASIFIFIIFFNYIIIFILASIGATAEDQME